MKEVVRTEILKLLEPGIISHIAGSRWVSPVLCGPKEGDITVVPNDKNELIPESIVTRYRMVIDFRKLNKSSRVYPIAARCFLRTFNKLSSLCSERLALIIT